MWTQGETLGRTSCCPIGSLGLCICEVGWGLLLYCLSSLPSEKYLGPIF